MLFIQNYLQLSYLPDLMKNVFMLKHSSSSFQQMRKRNFRFTFTNLYTKKQFLVLKFTFYKLFK